MLLLLSSSFLQSESEYPTMVVALSSLPSRLPSVSFTQQYVSVEPSPLPADAGAVSSEAPSAIEPRLPLEAFIFMLPAAFSPSPILVILEISHPAGGT